MKPQFIHLRLHTEYSLRDGILNIHALLEKTAEFAMPALAITDLGNLHATVKFYQAAIASGVKPIIGADVLVESRDAKNAPPCRLTLFCQSTLGYKNLVQLISKSYLEGQIAGRPIIKRAWLTAHATDLIALSGAEEGDIGQAIFAKDMPSAKNCIQYWQALFPNRFYIELSRVGKKHEHEYIQIALSLAETFTLPIVATNDVRFLERADFEAHEARVCIHEGVTLNDAHRSRHYTEQQYLKSQEEMCQLFADLPQALQNTVELAKRCNVTFDLGKNLLPRFEVPHGFTTESYLCKVAKAGLLQRLQTIFAGDENKIAINRQPYDDRLTRELDVINAMGFAGYFLIVADFTKWAKENGIPVGPGRGSGPGSVVAYALHITDLDPLALELLFERFLNPERVSLPDFDIDFCVEGRDRVIEYVMHKHGHNSVSQIITYGTMAAKAVVRDVGRVLAYPYGFVDKIAKLVPFELGITLEKALEQEPLLRERYEQEEEVRTLIDLARKLEGCIRNVGKHAGGIVIAPGKLTDFVPLYCEPHDATHPVTQFDKDDVESVGLVKFDFLGLKTLTIIDKALRIIKERATPDDPNIDIALIPLDDAKTFALLKACQSTAVFQLESPGMRDIIKRLQPDCFEDLMALVALFRPGPLQSGMVDDFIARKHGRAKATYPHPALEPVLRSTYGVIVYQEQVMQIAQVLAGYTLGAADILRRAMGKKKPEEMAKQRDFFCQGCVARGVRAEIASSIFDLMEKFAGYGFNKPHAASYALIAFQTAWLKAHHPAAFMASVLSVDMDKTDKIIILLEECKLLKLHVSPPDINKSDFHFKVLSDEHLMYGLGAIKGLGQGAIENIIVAREKDGHFKNLFDFCQRVDLRKVNKRALEAFIKSGCFDSFGTHRAALLATLGRALQQAEQALHNQTYGQHDFLSIVSVDQPIQYVEIAPWNEAEQLQGEKDTLGFYLTGHPLNAYLHELSFLTTCRLSELQPNQKNSRVAGIITKIRIRQTKRGDRIGIFSLDDGTTQTDVVCFTEPFQKYRHLLNEDELVIIEGEVGIDDYSNQPRILARDIYSIAEMRARFAKYIQIEFNQQQTLDLDHFKQLLTAHAGGNCKLVLRCMVDDIKADITLGVKWRVKPVDALLLELKKLFFHTDEQLSVKVVY